MPLIWDSQKQAFVETEPPLVYNPAIDAWQDTEGYEHNSELDAWEKVWPEKYYFYKNGIVSSGVNWNIDFTYNTNRPGGWKLPEKMMMGDDRIKFNIQKTLYMQVRYSSMINFSKFKKLYANVCVEKNNGGDYTPVYLMVVKDTHLTFSDEEVLAMTQVNMPGAFTLELDVSDINAYAHMRLQAQNHNGNAIYDNVGYYTEIYATK